MTNKPDEYLVSKGHAYYVLVLLFLLMAFDFIDRQVLASLLPAIKAEWSLSDTQLGMLVSSVNVAIALLALPVALLTDRWSRKNTIGIMSVFWSLATVACSFAGNFYQLLIARFAVGTGEAGYSAGGSALLGNLFPERKRATVVGIFQSGTMIGTVLGVVLGGVIAAKWGWRHAFGVVAVPGLILAFAAFFIKDYKTVLVQVTDKSGERKGASWLQVLAMTVRSPALVMLFIGHAAQLFFVGTFSNWLPSFFNRMHALPMQQAGLRTGLVLIVAAAGAALGGWFIDKLVGAKPQRRLFGCALFSLISACVFTSAFNLPASPTQGTLIFVGAFFMLAVLGPAMAAAMDLVHPGVRTSALGMMITFANLFGMALGPTVAGMLSDKYDLQTALLIVSCLPFVAGLGYAMAGAGYARTRANVGQAELQAA
jgi:MFS transporter, Spinster family, sphingosine-1-phosphate transporter